jgi:hypothetical protein
LQKNPYRYTAKRFTGYGNLLPYPVVIGLAKILIVTVFYKVNARVGGFNAAARPTAPAPRLILFSLLLLSF